MRSYVFRAPGMSAPWWTTLGAVIYLAAFAGLMQVPNSSWFLIGIAYHLPPSLACALALRSARRSQGSIARGWFCVSVCAGSWAIAEWIYAYHSFRGTTALFPGPADGLYLAGYGALIAAIPLISGKPRALKDPRLALDGFVILVVASVFFWQHVIKPTAVDTEGSLFGSLVAGSYPVMDLVLVGFLVASFYGTRGAFTRQASLLMLAAGVLVLADTLYSLRVLATGTVPIISYLDVAWLSAYWLIAIAAVSPGAAPLRKRRGSGWTEFLLPYLAAAPLAIDAADQLARDELGRAMGAGVLSVAVALLIRQGFTLRENLTLRAAAEFAADHDHLTGLLTRRAWESEILERRPTALAVLDIDAFKAINDAHGHPAGDVVLRVISKRMLAQLPATAKVARIGGEEFGVLLFDDGLEAVFAVARAIKRIAMQPVALTDGTEIRVTVSGGIGRYDDADTTDVASGLSRAFESADRALYRAKRLGGNRLGTARDEWSTHRLPGPGAFKQSVDRRAAS